MCTRKKQQPNKQRINVAKEWLKYRWQVHCDRPYPTTWRSSLPWLPGQCTPRRSPYLSDVPTGPCRGPLFFAHPLTPTALSSTLTPSLVVTPLVLPLHTSFWTNSFTPKSLPKLPKVYPSAPISQLVCLAGYSFTMYQPQNASKSQGKTFGATGRTLSPWGVCWARLPWLGRH